MVFIMHLRWLAASTIRVPLFISIALRNSEPQIWLVEINYLSWEVSPERVRVSHFLKKNPSVLRKPLFYCGVLTRALQWSQCTLSENICFIFVLFHIRVGLLSGIFRQVFLPVDVLIFLLSCLCYLLHPFRILWCDIPSNTGIRYTLWSSLLGLQTSNFLLASVIVACCPHHPVLEIWNDLKKCYISFEAQEWFRPYAQKVLRALSAKLTVVKDWSRKWRHSVEGAVIVFLRSAVSGLNHREDEIILMKLQKDRRQAHDLCIIEVVLYFTHEHNSIVSSYWTLYSRMPTTNGLSRAVALAL